MSLPTYLAKQLSSRAHHGDARVVRCNGYCAATGKGDNPRLTGKACYSYTLSPPNTSRGSTSRRSANRYL